MATTVSLLQTSSRFPYVCPEPVMAKQGKAGRFVPRLSWQSSSRFAVPFPFSLLLCPFLFFSLLFCPHANAEAQPFRRFVSSFRRFVSSFRRFVVHFV